LFLGRKDPERGGGGSAAMTGGEEQGRSLFGVSLTDRPRWQQFLICSSGFFFGYLVNGICEVRQFFLFSLLLRSSFGTQYDEEMQSMVRGSVSVTRIRGRDAVLLCHFFRADASTPIPWKLLQTIRLLRRRKTGAIACVTHKTAFFSSSSLLVSVVMDFLYTCLVSVVF
jgi:hypothetical protein